MREQSTKRELLVELTAEERAERAANLAKLVDEAAKQRLAIAEAAGAWAAKLRALKGYLSHLEADAEAVAAVVESGREEKTVACSWLFSLGAGYAFLVRDDTGALVAQRQLEEEERQADLLEVLREPTVDQLAEWLPVVKAEEW